MALAAMCVAIAVAPPTALSVRLPWEGLGAPDPSTSTGLAVLVIVAVVVQGTQLARLWRRAHL